MSFACVRAYAGVKLDFSLAYIDISPMLEVELFRISRGISKIIVNHLVLVRFVGKVGKCGRS